MRKMSASGMSNISQEPSSLMSHSELTTHVKMFIVIANSFLLTFVDAQHLKVAFLFPRNKGEAILTLLPCTQS